MWTPRQHSMGPGHTNGRRVHRSDSDNHEPGTNNEISLLGKLSHMGLPRDKPGQRVLAQRELF